MPNDRLSPDVE